MASTIWNSRLHFQCIETILHIKQSNACIYLICHALKGTWYKPINIFIDTLTCVTHFLFLFETPKSFVFFIQLLFHWVWPVCSILSLSELQSRFASLSCKFFNSFSIDISTCNSTEAFHILAQVLNLPDSSRDQIVITIDCVHCGGKVCSRDFSKCYWWSWSAARYVQHPKYSIDF